MNGYLAKIGTRRNVCSIFPALTMRTDIFSPLCLSVSSLSLTLPLSFPTMSFSIMSLLPSGAMVIFHMPLELTRDASFNLLGGPRSLRNICDKTAVHMCINRHIYIPHFSRSSTAFCLVEERMQAASFRNMTC